MEPKRRLIYGILYMASYEWAKIWKNAIKDETCKSISKKVIIFAIWGHQDFFYNLGPDFRFIFEKEQFMKNRKNLEMDEGCESIWGSILVTFLPNSYSSLRPSEQNKHKLYWNLFAWFRFKRSCCWSRFI